MSSLERVVYPSREGQKSMGQQQQQQQSQQPTTIQQQQNPTEQQSPNDDTSSSSSPPPPQATTMESTNNNNNNNAISSSSMLVEPSQSENFRHDVQRFKASGSDGYTSEQLQEQINNNNNNDEGMVVVVVTPNSDSSPVKEQQQQQQQLPTGSSSTMTSTTVSTTISSTTTTIADDSANNNNKNDPFKGKGNQYYEKVGPQSMNFRDGSRMNTFKDKAFAVATSNDDDAAGADGDTITNGDDGAEVDEDELRAVIEESDDDAVNVNGDSGSLFDDVDEEEVEELMMVDDIDDLIMEEDEAEQIVEEEEVTATFDRQIPSSGMDTSELSLDPKFIDFLPSDQVKEEEDLLLDEESIEGEGGAEPYMSTQLLKTRLHDLLEETESGSFVKMFRGSASYIANHRGTIAVYHIPGELLAWEGFPGLMDDIALTWLLGMKIVLVAGCRHQIDLRLEEDEGDEVVDRGYSGKVMMSSIRVTDEDTLRVVKEEAGFVRFEIERRLAKSLRLHGGLVKGSESLVGNVVSGNFYSAQPFGVIDGVDYCWTGFPRKVEVERIRQVHETNDIVLLTSLGVSPSGEIFNVNSEFLAATVAGAVSASKIAYFNVHGTSFQNKNTNKPVQNLRVSDAKALLAHYNMKIHPKGFALVDLDGNSPQQQVLRTPGSMETLIKVGYSMVALEKGVKRAHILAPENGALVQELYTRDGCGTLISRDIYEGIRRADVNDVSGIYDLIDPLVRAGTLVPRPKSKLEKEITGYYVYTRDGLIVATGQLKRFEGGFAEIGCLVVNKDYRKGGRGDAMLGYLERLSLQCGARKVFVLSTQTMDWFIERGFREVSVESLPPSRQAMYNKKRKSKIYMKEIDGERDLDAAELWWSNQVSS